MIQGSVTVSSNMYVELHSETELTNLRFAALWLILHRVHMEVLGQPYQHFDFSGTQYQGVPFCMAEQ